MSVRALLYISNYISSNVFILKCSCGVVIMANSIPSTYKQVSFIKNSSADLQKLLKSVFLLGPSKAVLSNGSVIVSSSIVSQDHEEDNQQTSENSSSSDDNENAQESDKSPNESFHYSILEAASYFLWSDSHIFYEKSKKKKKKKKNKNSHANQLIQEISDTSDLDNDQTAQQDDDQASQQDNDQTPQQDEVANKDNPELEFNQATDLEVIVNLPNEGCTKWHIRLNNVSDKDKVINALKSKKFRAAFDIANSQAATATQDGQSAEGITVLSATTMIDKKKEQLAPFIGKCRWAFDVGSEDNNDESFDLEIAIAPIDGKTKKPKTSTIYHAVFNIVGDITNGKLAWFDKFVKAKDFLTDNEDSDSENDASEMLHKWLQSNFKCVGDSSMYDEFLKVRKFVEDNLKKKTIETNKEESSSLASYISTIKSEKSFISF